MPVDNSLRDVFVGIEFACEVLNLGEVTEDRLKVLYVYLANIEPKEKERETRGEDEWQDS